MACVHWNTSTWPTAVLCAVQLAVSASLNLHQRVWYFPNPLPLPCGHHTLHSLCLLVPAGSHRPHRQHSIDADAVARHTYLGDLDDVRGGGAWLQEGSRLPLPLLPLSDVVLMPGQALPLKLLVASQQRWAAQAACLTTGASWQQYGNVRNELMMLHSLQAAAWLGLMRGSI
jgi:hypothetical protein